MSLPQPTYSPMRSSPSAAGVRHEPLVDQEVHRVPVAPGLTHRTRLDVAERGEPVGVDDESVGQAVGVLVVNDVRLVARVAREERVLVGERGPGLVEQVHLHAWREAVRGCAHVGVVDVVAVRKPFVEVGAVDGVGLHRVAVHSLEVARCVGEADRAPWPGGRGTCRGRRTAATAFWLAFVRQEFGVSGSQEQTNPVAQLSPRERGERVAEPPGRGRADLFRPLGDVVVVHVLVDVGDIAGQARGVPRQPAAIREEAAPLVAAQVGSGIVVPGLATVRCDKVLPEHRSPGLGVDDAEPAVAHVDDLPSRARHLRSC